MNSTLLNYGTVTPLLRNTLHHLMKEALFQPFLLVGGTNLSLRLGHRLSVDIDLFSDAQYGSLDYEAFESFLKSKYSYFEKPDKTEIISFGRSYYIGESKDECIKLDLMYTDPFIREPEIIDGIRLASIDDIIAMKIDTISRGGRKKDFWDIHKLMENRDLDEMFKLHNERYPWEHNEDLLLAAMTDFSEAENWPEPICIERVEWDEIKLDIIDAVKNYK